MNKAAYKVVRHNGTWALVANGMYFKAFRTREAARNAARSASGEYAASEIAPTSNSEATWQDDSG